MKRRQNKDMEDKILNTLKEDKRIFLKEWERLGEKVSYIQDLIERIQREEGDSEILPV